MTKIAFVTYREQPRMTPDDSRVIAPLAGLGIKLFGAAWDDLTVRWQDYDAVILRSTWDYHIHWAAFNDWLHVIEHINIPLWNPPALVRWNSHKTYLRELAQRGIPIVPTVFLAEDEEVDLATLLQEKNWDEVVIKPVLGASAFKLWRTNRAQAKNTQTRLERMVGSGGMLVQPLVTEIVQEGEWSLIYFREWNGDVVYSHAVLKRPAPGDVRVQGEYGGSGAAILPPENVFDGARKVIDAIEGDWLYARVDGVRVGDEFLLMELELIEPFLFLGQDPNAARRFATAIKSLLS